MVYLFVKAPEIPTFKAETRCKILEGAPGKVNFERFTLPLSTAHEACASAAKYRIGYNNALTQETSHTSLQTSTVLPIVSSFINLTRCDIR